MLVNAQGQPVQSAEPIIRCPKCGRGRSDFQEYTGFGNHVTVACRCGYVVEER